MLNIISTTITSSITKVTSLFNRQLQTKRFISIVLVGFLLLTTNMKQDTGNPVSNLFDKIVHQDSSQNDVQRPTTMREWNKQARETEGNPGERLKRIGEQSADAVKDMGEVYLDTAKRGAATLRNN